MNGDAVVAVAVAVSEDSTGHCICCLSVQVWQLLVVQVLRITKVSMSGVWVWVFRSYALSLLALPKVLVSKQDPN